LLRKDVADPACLFKKILQKKAPKFAQLLDLLAKMFGSAPLQARTFLKEEGLLKRTLDPSNQ